MFHLIVFMGKLLMHLFVASDHINWIKLQVDISHTCPADLAREHTCLLCAKHSRHILILLAAEFPFASPYRNAQMQTNAQMKVRDRGMFLPASYLET